MTERRPTVLFLNENIGGHATVHAHLRAALDGDDRIEARFLDVAPPGPLRRLASMPLPIAGRRDLDLQPLRSQLGVSAHARRLLRRERPFDVLHVYTQNAALLLGAPMGRVPTVITTDTTNALHNFRLPYRQPTRWTARLLPAATRLERRAFDRARLVIAQSEYVARSLERDYAVTRSKVRVVRFGVTDHGGSLATPAAGRPKIVFVGNTMERKGGYRLGEVHRRELAAAADLVYVTRDPVDPGPGVEVRNDIRQGDGQIWDVLRGAAVFALPSEIDYSPNAVLEAMAAGLPVVASRDGALEEMVEDGVSGFLVEPGDDRALASALGALVADPEMRRRMGQAGRSAFEARWDARIEVQELVDILLEVLDASRTLP